MRRISARFAGLLFLVAVALWAASSWADVPTVAIQGEQELKTGQPFSVTVNIRHHGNNFIHHLSKLVIYVNGKEEKVWEYNWRTYPREETWSISHELTLNQDATISAIATCNMHGPSKEATLPAALGSSR